MRALDVKTNESVAQHNIFGDLDDRQPCYYANLESSQDRKEYLWKVGCKKNGITDECEFLACKAGDIEDEKFWNWINSDVFAIRLIDTFRQGGQKAVKQWVKNGCP